MLRTSIVRLARANSAKQLQRSFTMSAVRAAEGDTGSVRQSGTQDSFQKREAASENLFIRQKEMESLKRLKAKLAEQRKHLDELDNHIAELEKDKGGEHH